MQFLHRSTDSINNQFDFLDDPLQDGDNLCYASPGWPLGMGYGYYNKRLVLITHIWIRGINGEPCYFCAVFYRPFMVSDASWNDRQFWINRLEAKLPLSMGGRDYIEQAVLVRIIEVPEQPQQGRQIGVRSVVRLYKLDFCPHSAAERRDSFQRPSLELCERIRNRELQFPLVGRRVTSAFSNGDGVNKMIEGGSEVVDAIPGNQCPPVERGLILDFEDDAVAGSIGITLSATSIWIGILPRKDF